MKAEVLINATSPYGEGEYQTGDVGIVDGYCRGGDNVPCAVVIVRERFVLIPVYSLEFLHWIYEKDNN